MKDLRSVRQTTTTEHIYHSYYKYYLFLEPTMLRDGWSRDRIMTEINAAGVPCTVGSCSEVYLERAFQALGPAPEPLPIAHRLGLTSLMFLVHPTLREEDTLSMIDIARDIIATAMR